MEFYKVNSFSHLADLIQDGNNLHVQLLLQNADSCQLVDRSGSTLLHVAVQSCNEAITQYLLDKELIDIDAQDEDGQTPVMLLIELCYENNMKYECEGILQVLLKSKPNLHIRNNFGKCALRMVFEMSMDYLEIIGLFADAIKIGNQNDNEVIAWKLMNLGCPLYHTISFKNSEITRIMLEQGCPIDAKDSETGKTALHVAVTLTDLENVKLLIEYGADVDALDSQNRVPFFDGDYYGGSDVELQILKILLDRGTLLTTIDDSGYCQITPVLWATNRESLLMVLDSNIDLDAPNSHGITLMHYFISNAKVLRNNPDIIKKLGTKNFDVNALDEGGRSLLFNAACDGIWRLVELLLYRGAETVNYSPMYLVSTSTNNQSQYKMCVELLLLHGEDPQVITSSGKTILDGMASTGCYYATEAILGQLAIYEDHGIEISNAILASIDAHQFFKDQYELCKQQFEELKTSVVHASMTLYKILEEEQEAIAVYARQDDFYRGLINFHNNYSSNSYYCHLLRCLLQKPIKFATLRRQTIDILCEIMGLNYYSNHIVIDKICGYIVDDKLLKQYTTV